MLSSIMLKLLAGMHGYVPDLGSSIGRPTLMITVDSI